MQAERPETMKAWTYNKFGNPQEVLELTPDLPVRARKAPNELIVKVHAAAINPVDWKMCEGYLSLVAGRPPITAGFDFSGVVVEVGPKVRKFKVGDEVYGMADYKTTGSFAEYLTIRETLVAPKPKSLSHVEAASIPLVGLTTYQGLAGAGKLPLKGLKVLIIGGSSGTGSFGVQLAKHEGAEVTAVCSTKNVEFVQELGAARVIDYTQEDWGEVLKGQNYDVVYDCVGGEDVWLKALQVLSPKGRFATIAGDKQEPVTISKVFNVAGAIINRNFWNLVGSYPSYAFVMCEASGKQLTAISELIEKGIIKPIVAHVYKFDEAKEMFAESMSNRVRGKLVLAVTEEGEKEKESETITEEEEEQPKEEKDEGKGKDKEVTEAEPSSVPEPTEGEEEKPKEVENKEEEL